MLLLRSHTYLTIVGFVFCLPSDAAERVLLYHRAYTRITPITLDIYEDNTHIKPSIGYTINTGTHMTIFVRIVGLCTTSMLECLFLTKGKFIYASNIFITRPEHYQKFNPLNLGGFRLFFLVGYVCLYHVLWWECRGAICWLGETSLVYVW